VSRRIAENPITNSILTSIPDTEFELIRPHLEWQVLPLHTVLAEPGSPLQFAYFLNDGLASSVVPTGDGRSVEVAGVGKDGFVGVCLVFGLTTSLLRTVMRVAGTGYRIAGENLNRILPSTPRLFFKVGQHGLLQNMQAAQTAACNRLHDLEQRLARWLLVTYDGVGPEFAITQEYLADMLGTGRPSVSLVAGQMQKAGVIQYTRGSVRIVDRTALERLSCECYGNVQRLRDEIDC
jgi:CRP-like cAMP-binding protein